MTHEFPSEGWMAAWCGTVNADEEYAEVAGEWGVGLDGDTVVSPRRRRPPPRG